MNDERMITAIKNRSEAAINEVIKKYSKLLWSVAGAVLNNMGSTQDVEECVADTFIYLWEHPDKYDPQRGKLKTWLSIVARTQAVNRCREISKRNTFRPAYCKRLALRNRFQLTEAEFDDDLFVFGQFHTLDEADQKLPAGVS